MAADSELLLLLLAEQLKTPWLQVAYAAELSRQQAAIPTAAGADATERLHTTVEVVSQAALQLIDGYLLSAQLEFGDTDPGLEPVSMSSTLYDVAQRLDGYAKAYDCQLELKLQGRSAPVMANRRALDAALTNLGYSFIEAAHHTLQSREDNRLHSNVTLVMRHNAQGLSAGMFSQLDGLSNELLKRARVLYGYARQPLSGFTSGSGAGVFVADALISSMDSRLKTSRYGELTGLAATFVPSRQLAMV